MNQYSAIREVRRLLRAVMEQSQRPELIEQLEEIDVRLKAFHDRGCLLYTSPSPRDS